MSSKISFKDLYFLSTHGLSTREIGEMSGLSRSCIGYQQNKYGLNTIRTTKDFYLLPILISMYMIRTLKR